MNRRNQNAIKESLINTSNSILNFAEERAHKISLLVREVEVCKGSVVVTGVGKSGIVGQKISSSLRSIGVRSSFIDSQDAFHGDIGYLRTDDLVLAISNSGKTKELISFLEYAKTIGCRVAGILGSSQSQASKYMDLIIDSKVKTESHDANFIPSASTSLAMACGDALVIGLAERANFGPDEFQKFHSSGSLGIELSLRVGDLMIPKKNCAVISEDQSVKEAAMEMDKKPHGIALVEGGGGAYLGVLTDGDLRRALINSLEVEKVRVRDIFSRQALTVRTTNNLREAISSLESGRKNPISAAPVVDASEVVVGIVTIHLLTQVGVS